MPQNTIFFLISPKSNNRHKCLLSDTKCSSKMLEHLIVQHRATRLVTSIKGKSYGRLRGDPIQFYKIKNKIDHVNLRNDLLEKDRGIEKGPEGNLRRPGVCFHRKWGKINSIRVNFFTNRIIPLWNDVPVGVKEARTLDSFKAGLDKLKVFTIK